MDSGNGGGLTQKMVGMGGDLHRWDLHRWLIDCVI